MKQATKKTALRLPKAGIGKLLIPVLEHKVMGVNVMRGYARLCDLSRMSRADIFDEKTNPAGTQRDLSPKHARDAYIYAKTEDFAFWPEIVLCARSSDVIKLKKVSTGGFSMLTVDLAEIRKTQTVMISRLDGNHRLHFAGGDYEGFDPIEKVVSFCLAYDLNIDQEIKLFRDINNNQRRMNTSHLDQISARLTETDRLKQKEPDLYIAKRLADDRASPLHGLVYQGGKRPISAFIPLRTLRTGISYMLSRPTKLNALDDADAQYRVVRNYFDAVKKWIPGAWKEPRDFVALRGAGLWGICFVGAEVIDRALSNATFKSEDMLKVLRSGKEWDWSNKGEFQGYSGRGGAVQIRDQIVSEFQDENGVSVKELFKRIMRE